MKHWVFDLDGTLVDSFAHYFESTAEIFKHFGVPFNSELHYSILTEPLVQLYAQKLGKENLELALQMLQDKSNNDATKIRAFSGVHGALQELKKNDARIGVWTNRDLESATLILEHSGLKDLVEICVSGTCTTLRKPDPEGLLRVIQHFNCRPSEVIMIGDHEHDVSAAKDVGAIGVRASWHGYWKMDACKTANHQFHEFSDFKNFVLTKFNK